MACRWVTPVRSCHALRLPALIAISDDTTRSQRQLCVCRKHNVSEGPKMMHQVTPVQVVQQSFYEVRPTNDMQRLHLTIMPKKRCHTAQAQLSSMPRSQQQCLLFIMERGDMLIHNLEENHAATSDQLALLVYSKQVRRALLQVGAHPWPSKLLRRSEAFPAIQRRWSGWRRLSCHELQDPQPHPCPPSARKPQRKRFARYRASGFSPIFLKPPAQSTVDRRTGTNLCSS